MTGPIVECVPNFSEGRDSRVVAAIADAMRGARVLHTTADSDHNRSVITLAGAPEDVAAAAIAGVAEAVARIDLSRHAGVHPRIGAADVIPFVPLRGATLADCARLAQDVGRRIWSSLGVPVYLYGEDRRPLEQVRRNGGADLAPDFGHGRHPTAGATAVGARKLLVAFNINLATADVQLARRIARRIRASSGGLPCVKAMGVMLASRNLAQVSMNLTDFERTPVHAAFRAVRDAARESGVEIASSEIIGLIPRAALEGSGDWLPTVENFASGLVLEDRLDGL
ncbi:MAG: glutamate formimidoyltransferase [Bryobacteraceae bacterium]